MIILLSVTKRIRAHLTFVAQHATLIVIMIKDFKHKGLKLFFETGKTTGIQAKHKNKIRMQLAALDSALRIEDMDIPGYRLHELKGNRKQSWSITVNGNWRLTFKFIESDVYVLNYEDYH